MPFRSRLSKAKKLVVPDGSETNRNPSARRADHVIVVWPRTAWLANPFVGSLVVVG